MARQKAQVGDAVIFNVQGLEGQHGRVTEVRQNNMAPGLVYTIRLLGDRMQVMAEAQDFDQFCECGRRNCPQDNTCDYRRSTAPEGK